MYRRPSQSQFVRLIMSDATEAEIADATERLFSVIEILDRMVARLEVESPDSLPSSRDDRVPIIPVTNEV